MPDVTKMVVKVDLKCEKCKKKIKKVLCKIPQIENQVYDEKNNAVTITVVCCSPEKIMKKILCIGGKIITGIEIVTPTPKPPEPTPKPPDPISEPPRCNCCVYAWGPCYPGHGWPLPPCYCSCHGCYMEGQCMTIGAVDARGVT